MIAHSAIPVMCTPSAWDEHSAHERARPRYSHSCDLLPPQEQLAGAKCDPKQMQIYLMGFLEKHTTTFMRDLWTLLISAQENELGIPVVFLERKKEEIRQKKMEQASERSPRARLCVRRQLGTRA